MIYLHFVQHFITGFLLLIGTTSNFAQPRTDKLLRDIFASEEDSLFQSVIQHPGVYRYQMIYTQINRDKNNVPSFTNYYFNYDSLRYFNPASTVKMPLAFLSLEKLNQLKQKGVNMFTPMQFDSGYSRQTTLYKDSTSENGLPSIAQFIRKAFLISDNDAYNRMYEFVGQQTTNRRLHEMGYPDLRITRRFMRMSADENRHTNPIRFVKPGGSLIYLQPMAFNTDSFDFSHINKMGNAYMNAQDSLINEPIDFTTANNVTVYHLQQLLQAVMFPNSVPVNGRFNLTKEDYDFLYRFLSQYPSETAFPKYDTSLYYDSYVKFFFRNESHKMPAHIRVFNKVGWAYGCLTDVSYVADFQNKVEFMLTATVYVNSDNILNDNKYDYDNIGYPFLYQLGQCIYNYELKRTRKFRPDLSNFKFRYEKRIEDGRPAVKEVDN
ncbi:MAG TPA: serine hydrolase [Chitinophagaceae bacterium]|nr:serine hydrolase [Chitinophagaceae bacterium]